MTEITDEGRKLAAELANAETRAHNQAQGVPPTYTAWYPSDAVPGSRSNDAFTALARLATDHLALKAEHEKAVADLREIDRLLIGASWADPEIGRVHTIAAKYREADPLVEALGAISTAIHAEGFADRLRAELSKRGFELNRVKP